MKALVFREPGRIEFQRIPVPEISHGKQVLIRVANCGVCGSDVKIMEGKHAYKADTVLGHEFNGTVVDIGSEVTSVRLDERVALDNNPRCGLCEYCRSGFSSQCVELKNRTLGVFRNGGYAEYCVAPEDVCFKLPDEIDDVVGTQVETLGTVLNGMNAVQMQPWDSVLVLGCGPIGYLFTSLAKGIAAQVAVTEIDPFRFSIAEQLGVPALNPECCNLEEEVVRMTRGKKFDVVIDAVGNQLENALNYVTSGGKILAFGMDNSFKATITPNDITRKGIRIIGTYIGQNTCLPAIKILRSGKINMKPFFTDVIPLEEGVTAFCRLGLNLATLEHIPKQAMKLVLHP